MMMILFSFDHRFFRGDLNVFLVDCLYLFVCLFGGGGTRPEKYIHITNFYCPKHPHMTDNYMILDSFSLFLAMNTQNQIKFIFSLGENDGKVIKFNVCIWWWCIMIIALLWIFLLLIPCCILLFLNFTSLF